MPVNRGSYRCRFCPDSFGSWGAVEAVLTFPCFPCLNCSLYYSISKRNMFFAARIVVVNLGRRVHWTRSQLTRFFPSPPLILLHQHIQSKHVFSCSECGREFASEGGLDQVSAYTSYVPRFSTEVPAALQRKTLLQMFRM